MTAESDIKKIKSLQRENEELRYVLEIMKTSPLIVGHVQKVLKDGRVIVSHVPGNQLLIPQRPDLKPEPGDYMYIRAIMKIYQTRLKNLNRFL